MGLGIHIPVSCFNTSMKAISKKDFLHKLKKITKKEYPTEYSTGERYVVPDLCLFFNSKTEASAYWSAYSQEFFRRARWHQNQKVVYVSRFTKATQKAFDSGNIIHEKEIQELQSSGFTVIQE